MSWVMESRITASCPGDASARRAIDWLCLDTSCHLCLDPGRKHFHLKAQRIKGPFPQRLRDDWSGHRPPGPRAWAPSSSDAHMTGRPSTQSHANGTPGPLMEQTPAYINTSAATLSFSVICSRTQIEPRRSSVIIRGLALQGPIWCVCAFTTELSILSDREHSRYIRQRTLRPFE